MKLSRRQALATGAAALIGGPAALAKAEEDRKRAELLEEWMNSGFYDGWSRELRPDGQHGPIRVISGGNRSGATNPVAVKAAQETIRKIEEILDELTYTVKPGSPRPNEVPFKIVRLK